MTEDTSDPTGAHSSETIELQQESDARSRYKASELFGRTTEVIIELEEVEYRLRITSNGKLILTK